MRFPTRYVLILAFPILASAELPKESLELIDKLKLWEKVELEKINLKIREKRAEVTARLEDDLVKTTKLGDLDGALSIKEEIKRLNGSTAIEDRIEKKEPEKPVIPGTLIGKWDWYNGKEFLTIDRKGNTSHTFGWELTITVEGGEFIMQKSEKGSKKKSEFLLTPKGEDEIIVRKLGTNDPPFTITRIKK